MAFDASRMEGKAGSHGRTADYYAKRAEKAARAGACKAADDNVKQASVYIKRAFRTRTFATLPGFLRYRRR